MSELTREDVEGRGWDCGDLSPHRESTTDTEACFSSVCLEGAPVFRGAGRLEGRGEAINKVEKI